LEAGILIDEFWQHTPRELQLLADGRNACERRWALFLAWHCAALARTERLPTLEQMLETKAAEELAAERRVHEQEFADLLLVRARSKRGDVK
jgi:hypothetical protein